jgi:hypothetical protein
VPQGKRDLASVSASPWAGRLLLMSKSSKNISHRGERQAFDSGSMVNIDSFQKELL